MLGGPELPDVHSIQLQLLRLERAEADLTVRRDRIYERLAQFPSDFTRAQYRELSANLAEVQNRIEALHAQLGEVRQRPSR